MRRACPAFLAGALILGLAGCTVYETVTDVISAPIVLPCPDYKVVGDAVKLVRFQEGPGRDLIDINFESEIEGLQLVCTTKIDRETHIGTMDVEITVDFKTQRGPANRDRQGPFEYFISVIDSTRKILYREAFKVNIRFPGNKTRLTLGADPVTLEIPITPQRSSRTYQILTGFKLTRDELRHNRDRRKSELR
jgi:hypothetical protein